MMVTQTGVAIWIVIDSRLEVINYEGEKSHRK